MKKKGWYIQILLFFVILVLMGLYIKGSPTIQFKDQLQFVFLVLSIFLFGFFITFSINERKERLNKIRENLRKQDAILLSIYFSSQIFHKNTINKIRNEIDQFLISQIDYDLNDFDQASFSQIKYLYSFFAGLKLRNEAEEDVRRGILDSLKEILDLHKVVSYQISNKMQPFEWFISISLSLIILFGVFYGNDQSIVSVLIISALGICLYLLQKVLYDLNSLKWQEDYWIWIPLTNLFLELDLIPYIPELLIKEKRLELSSLPSKKIRLVEYPHPYPDFEDKKIKIRTL